MLPHVTQIESLGGFRMRVRFDNGREPVRVEVRKALDELIAANPDAVD